MLKVIEDMELKLFLQTNELSNENFHNSKSRSHLTNPKQKHPFDNLGLDFRTILLCHEALWEVVLLLFECDLKALSDRSGFWRLDICRLQNSENFCRAHDLFKNKRTLIVGSICKLLPTHSVN